MKQLRDRGFTIVELLIVIVIIAILATITIVAYNGITQRAHTSAAQAAAQSVASKAEAYNAENGQYPSTLVLLTGAPTGSSWSLSPSAVSSTPPSPVTITGLTSAATMAAPTTGQQDNRVGIVACSVGGSVVGLYIYYWDYTGPATKVLTAGNPAATGFSCAAVTS